MDIEELILLKEHSQLLVMNNWRYEIPYEQRNVIIANALNHCTNDKKLNLTGYLITNRRLFLIGASITTPFNEVLNHFYYHVAVGILKYKKTIGKYESKEFLKPDSYNQLFTKYPFYNNYIRNIITGKKVTLDYYDPNLERLEAYIYNHNYCSALDHAGGKSPVIVATNELML